MVWDACSYLLSTYAPAIPQQIICGFMAHLAPLQGTSVPAFPNQNAVWNSTTLESFFVALLPDAPSGRDSSEGKVVLCCHTFAGSCGVYHPATQPRGDEGVIRIPVVRLQNVECNKLDAFLVHAWLEKQVGTTRVICRHPFHAYRQLHNGQT
jgi:hypothetical protein